MAQGSQIKALQIMSRAQGWDPTELIGKSYEVPVNQMDRGGVGPTSPSVDDSASVGAGDQRFEVGAGGKPEVSRATHNADPTPGMPGA